MAATLQTMRRLSLRDLATADPHALSDFFIQRISAQRDGMAAAASRAGGGSLVAAINKLERGWTRATNAAGSEAEALIEAEDGAAAAVVELQKLPRADAMGSGAQSLLRQTFSAVVSCRAIVHAIALRSAEEPLLLPASELGHVLAHVAEDSRAFCREKYGDSPEIVVQQVTEAGSTQTSETPPPDAASPVFLASFVGFTVHELLKNAMGAHVRAVGADKLEHLPPIALRHGSRAGKAFVGVTDFGEGWADAPDDALRFLHTTNAEREPTYTYSRQFGSTFEGLGMGLPLTALHAQYHGGDLHLHRPPRGGVHAAVTIDVSGDGPEPDIAVLGL